MNPEKTSLSDRLRHLAAACLLAGSASLQAALPELGSAAQQALTPQQQVVFRAAFLRSLYQHYHVNTDPVLNQWLSELGHRLAQYAELPHAPVFLLIDNPEINAFAGPGGIIGIHTGLITAAESTDEVAAVLAHELAHVQQRHLLRQIRRAGRDNLAAFATLLAAILIGQQDTQAGLAAFYAGQGFNAQRQLAFSRRHETEADALGIRILAEAGYDPRAMASFFDKLYQRTRTDSTHTPEILRTHPVSTHRLADATNRAQHLSTENMEPRLHQPDLLPFIQARLQHTPETSEQPACLKCYRQSLRDRQPHCPLHCTRNNWIIAVTRPAPDSLLKRWPNNAALRIILAAKTPSSGQAIRLLSTWQDQPAPLRTLMLEQLAHRQKTLGRTDASKLYAALAAREKGYLKQAKALLAEIKTNNLNAQERLLRQSLDTQAKAVHPNNQNKQKFILPLNITMTSPAKTLAFAGGLSNLMLQEQRLAPSYRLSSHNKDTVARLFRRRE